MDVCFDMIAYNVRIVTIFFFLFTLFFFFLVYTAEAFLKIVGYGLRKYLLSGWNM